MVHLKKAPQNAIAGSPGRDSELLSDRRPLPLASSSYPFVVLSVLSWTKTSSGIAFEARSAAVVVATLPLTGRATDFVLAQLMLVGAG